MSGLVANYESGEEPSPTAPPQNDEEYDPLAAANDADEYAGDSGGDGEPPMKQAPDDTEACLLYTSPSPRD